MVDELRHALIASAGSLEFPPGTDIAYGRQAAALAARATALVKRANGYPDFLGSNNTNLLVDNHNNHVRYIESVLTLFDPESFVETLIWVYRTYMAHGFSPRYWEVAIPCWITAINELLEADARRTVLPLYEWLLEHHPDILRMSRETPSAWEPAVHPAHLHHGAE